MAAGGQIRHIWLSMSKLKGNGTRGIALTGYGSDSDIRASLAAGFDVHMTKPVTLEQLVSTIQRLFEPAR